MGRYRAEWGNDGRLWGTFQPSCVFNGLVDGFAEILILFGGSIVANIAAVLVVVGFGYAAAFQELFRPEFPALSRPPGKKYCLKFTLPVSCLLPVLITILSESR